MALDNDRRSADAHARVVRDRTDAAIGGGAGAHGPGSGRRFNLAGPRRARGVFPRRDVLDAQVRRCSLEDELAAAWCHRPTEHAAGFDRHAIALSRLLRRDPRRDFRCPHPTQLRSLCTDEVLGDHVGSLPRGHRALASQIFQKAGRHLREVRLVSNPELVGNLDLDFAALVGHGDARVFRLQTRDLRSDGREYVRFQRRSIRNDVELRLIPVRARLPYLNLRTIAAIESEVGVAATRRRLPIPDDVQLRVDAAYGIRDERVGVVPRAFRP